MRGVWEFWCVQQVSQEHFGFHFRISWSFHGILLLIRSRSLHFHIDFLVIMFSSRCTLFHFNSYILCDDWIESMFNHRMHVQVNTHSTSTTTHEVSLLKIAYACFACQIEWIFDFSFTTFWSVMRWFMNGTSFCLTGKVSLFCVVICMLIRDANCIYSVRFGSARHWVRFCYALFCFWCLSLFYHKFCIPNWPDNRIAIKSHAICACD